MQKRPSPTPGRPALLAMAALAAIGCGNPRDPSIEYTPMTPEAFAALPPEEQDLPEIREAMGDQWKDPALPQNASNPRR